MKHKIFSLGSMTLLTDDPLQRRTYEWYFCCGECSEVVSTRRWNQTVFSGTQHIERKHRLDAPLSIK